ncbi:MAG: NAD(P)/FAD-dependent oxidoreductase [Chloroflexi bacterium]|nr:NAD(P)/FAD-dependent oxidoreductase [Chloroflexota bacterium]
MTEKLNLVIIGGGPAGMVAALSADPEVASINLISNAAVGGRAGWHSLLPSKVLLTAADRHHQAGADIPPFHQLTRRIARLAEQYNGKWQERLEAHGVNIISGNAHFIGPHEVQIESPNGGVQTLGFDKAIVASGSTPIFPPALKPNGKEIIAPRFVKHLPGLPQHMIVVGGGITGAEFVYAFNSLGVQVTWLVDQYGVLPPYERSVVDVLVGVLVERGVDLVEGVAVAEVKAENNSVTATLEDGSLFAAEQAFIAIGRRPDLANLNLSAAGFDAETRALTVDEFGRTAIPHIYAAGDVTGPPLVVNKAWDQARVAARHATGRPTPALRSDVWVEAVYSHPQVAQVGLTAMRAVAQGRSVRERRLPFSALLKSRLLDEQDGFLTLCSDPDTDVILGAAAVGDHAADVLAPIALAIRLAATVDDLAAIFPAHPSLSELPFDAARFA